jgi:hypothetical protein
MSDGYRKKGDKTMRGFVALPVSVMLALAVPVMAQQPAGTFFGSQPRNITFKPIDTSNAVGSLNVNKAFRPPRAPSTFSLSNVFPKISLGSWPPKTANPPVFPSTSTPAKTNSFVNQNMFGPPGQ